MSPTSQERFEALFQENVEPVARYVARRTDGNDVQDVVSETFLVAWRRLDDVPSDALPWLFVTARKVMANRHRSTARRSALRDRLASDSAWRVRPADDEIAVEVDLRLLAAIASLPESEREAFMLVAWEGLDAPRAARAAGCSAATFRMRLHRARRRLKDSLGPDRPFAPTTDARASLEDTR